jgi:phosphoglycerol transferase MdoB-like AlkP superfamily enzyme
MTLANSQSPETSAVLFTLKSFSVWVFTLTVCMIVIGFPVFVLVVSLSALAAFVLDTILPFSSILFVSISVLGVHAVGVMLAAAWLTSKGIHPQEVDFLRWLSGNENPLHTSVYASCPLTCDVTEE